jgi:hypothetical protein
MRENGRMVLSMGRANTKARTVFGSKADGRWVNV